MYISVNYVCLYVLKSKYQQGWNISTVICEDINTVVEIKMSKCEIFRFLSFIKTRVENIVKSIRIFKKYR